MRVGWRKVDDKGVVKKEIKLKDPWNFIGLWFSNVLGLTLNSLITMHSADDEKLARCDLCPQSNRTARCFFCWKIKTLICNWSMKNTNASKKPSIPHPSTPPTSGFFCIWQIILSVICGSEFQPGCVFPLQCWKGVEGCCLAAWCSRFLLVINWIPPKFHRATPSA